MWAFLPEPPVCVFRIGTREVHNKLEKNRCVHSLVWLWARPPWFPQSFLWVCPCLQLLCPQALTDQRSPPFPRRAHLKECFETLKRNIPNVDDKKTSNLSVLRTALRYIQVWGREGGLGGAVTAAAPASSCYRQAPPPASTRALSTWLDDVSGAPSPGGGGQEGACARPSPPPRTVSAQPWVTRARSGPTTSLTQDRGETRTRVKGGH